MPMNIMGFGVGVDKCEEGGAIWPPLHLYLEKKMHLKKKIYLLFKKKLVIYLLLNWPDTTKN